MTMEGRHGNDPSSPIVGYWEQLKMLVACVNFGGGGHAAVRGSMHPLHGASAPVQPKKKKGPDPTASKPGTIR